MSKNKKDINDVFVQLGCVLNNQEIIKFSKELLELVNDKITNKVKDFKEKLFEIYSISQDCNEQELINKEERVLKLY